MDGGDQSYDEVERLIDPHDVGKVVSPVQCLKSSFYRG